MLINIFFTINSELFVNLFSLTPIAVHISPSFYTTIWSYDSITRGWRKNIISPFISFRDYNHGLKNYSSGQTQPAACFCMAHELSIGCKEEGRRGQGAKEGEGRREGKRRGGEYVTDYMWPLTPTIFTLWPLNENVCQLLDYTPKSLWLKVSSYCVVLRIQDNCL